MMRKTADLTLVLRTLVDTQEDKPQKVIAKRAGWVLYQNIIMESWLELKSVEEKVHEQ